MTPVRAPAFTALLEMLPPGAPAPDPESVGIAADMALSEGLLEADGAEPAVAALVAACHGASAATGACPPERPAVREGTGCVALPAHPGFVGLVIFKAAEVRDRARRALLSGDGDAHFGECFGGMPEQVGSRIACADLRPVLRPVLLQTAAEHLAREVLGLASRLPGAEVSPAGDVTWTCAARSREGLMACLAWLSLPGPGALASFVVVTGPHGDRQ